MSAIEDYTAVLAVYGEENSPKKRAATRHDLGRAYWKLPTGDRAQNLKKAIEACEAALQIYTERDFPADCGHDLSPSKRGVRGAPGVFWEKNIAPNAIAV
jgi:hypothetical protein